MIIIQLDSEQLSSLIQKSIRKVLLEKQSEKVEVKAVNEKILNVKEAAEFLSLSVPTIYSMVSRGELPVMKRSKRIYFTTSDLIAYLKEGRKKSNSEIESEAEQYLFKKKGGKNA